MRCGQSCVAHIPGVITDAEREDAGVAYEDLIKVRHRIVKYRYGARGYGLWR